jgi:hypothetical protein
LQKKGTLDALFFLSFLTSFFPNPMEPSSDRRKKSDKAKDTHAKYGAHSAKHARVQAAQATAHPAAPKPVQKTKK